MGHTHGTHLNLERSNNEAAIESFKVWELVEMNRARVFSELSCRKRNKSYNGALDYILKTGKREVGIDLY